MQKAGLGVSVGLLGSAMYLISLFSGFLPAVVLAGYVLLCEQNVWLKRCAVKAVSLLVFFSLLQAPFQLIPNTSSMVNNLIFTLSGGLGALSTATVFTTIAGSVEIIKKVIFIILGIKALKQKTIAVPVIDRLIQEHMV